ncbi:MAG: transporter [Robiginitalea sp.]
MAVCLTSTPPKLRYILLLLVTVFPGLSAQAQYTDVINSNRPGQSVSAYAVGTGVFQLESGLFYEQRDHSVLDTESGIFGLSMALRYGLLFETLELHYEGRFQSQDVTYTNTGTEERFTDFDRNRLGLKFLVFDPYKDPKRNQPNLYSWRADNVFQLRNLIPAVSVYAGANFVLGDNPFYPEDPTFSPRAMVATQSRLTPRFVLITNIAYDRIGTDFPEWSYLISLSHAFRNPRWSIFVENQGIDSDRYSDVLLRSGIAYLVSKSFQADLLLGASFKNTPSRIFIAGGISYRLDHHQDKLKPIEDQDPQIGRNSMRKKGGGTSRKERKRKRKQQKSEIDW